MTRERLEWVDALKGIGIIAVVAGHVWTRGVVRDAIYSFHMPLFFILSGYTARHLPWRQGAPALIRALALPFLCFSALLIAADFAIEGLRGVRPIFASWSSAATTILFATEKLRGPFTILWFIPCLLIARLAWNAIIGAGRRADDLPVIVMMIGMFACAVLLQHVPSPSPFALRAVPGAILMIWAGALWRLWGQPSAVAVPAFAVLSLLGLFWFPPVNMKLGDLGWTGLSLGGAAATTMLLAMMARQLPGLSSGIFARIGKASLVIMYVHVALVHYLTPYAARPILFIVAVLVPFALDWLIRRFRLARKLFLGEISRSN